MAKLKSSGKSSKTKLPSLGAGSASGGSIPKTAAPKDVSGQIVKVNTAGRVVQALNFGSLHTKVSGSSSTSQWGGLLNMATSGGGILGGGLLSTGTLGFIGKLFNLFGGSKSTPAAPTPFVMPAPQTTSLNVGIGGGSSNVSLGVQASAGSGAQNGPIYQQTVLSTADHATQSAQVVQIVKQALLTSSSLNDVISEI